MRCSCVSSSEEKSGVERNRIFGVKRNHAVVSGVRPQVLEFVTHRFDLRDKPILLENVIRRHDHAVVVKCKAFSRIMDWHAINQNTLGQLFQTLKEIPERRFDKLQSSRTEQDIESFRIFEFRHKRQSRFLPFHCEPSTCFHDSRNVADSPLNALRVSQVFLKRVKGDAQIAAEIENSRSTLKCFSQPKHCWIVAGQDKVQIPHVHLGGFRMVITYPESPAHVRASLLE